MPAKNHLTQSKKKNCKKLLKQKRMEKLEKEF